MAINVSPTAHWRDSARATRFFPYRLSRCLSTAIIPVAHQALDFWRSHPNHVFLSDVRTLWFYRDSVSALASFDLSRP